MVSQQRHAGHMKKNDKATISLNDIDKNQMIADNTLQILSDKDSNATRN
jgi:hypothetical protein